MRHLIDIDDFKKEELEKVLKDAIEISKNPGRYMNVCDGKILASLFYEPSTRTQLSFQTAMLRLGGKVIGFDNPNSSSVAKGENLKDTIKVISGYADIIAIRHPLEGSAKAASLYSDCSVVNAGDGGHLHPTQTLTDLVTLLNEKGRLDNLNIGICGDLKNGRTVHSLVRAMSLYSGVKFVFISTEKLSMPQYILNELNKKGIEVKLERELKGSIKNLDVLYMTRIQRERFDSEIEYNKQKGIYCLDMDKLKTASKDLSVMHPLPRVDEIAPEIDNDPRAIYFKQAKFGVFARMSLIKNLFKISSHNLCKFKITKEICNNKNCITKSENYLENRNIEKAGQQHCFYCDERK